MKNKFPLLLLILVNFVCVDIFAQVSSMSDSQVMDFVIKENEKGTSRDEIVKKLIERDVPIQQIQRIKKKYEKQLNNKQVGAKNLESDKVTNSRNRTYKNFDEKPENKEKIKKYVKEGRFAIGPWYVLQDEFLTSSEANIRNLLVGMDIARSYGKITPIGYFPDSFGNLSQAPQMANCV